MAGPDRPGSTGLDRRASTRLSIERQDEGSDYDLDAMGISDGFRPSSAMNSAHTRIHSQTSQPSSHLPGRRATPPPRPSSATKPKALDSFALRHDGVMGPTSRNSINASTSNAGPTRSSSVSTDTAAYVRFESPYQGPSGPSHPYQMYPQESRLARTASIATTSTVQAPERSYAGPTGPTHPYGMYPQNTVPEAESTNDAARAPPIPVGFPGSNNDYRRRLGPDGEEIADIIGPDGHTEQLPPYSKYPQEAFARETRPSVQVPVVGAGGIGLATRNPEFASQENLNSPQSRQSIHSVVSNLHDNSLQSNIADPGPSEKQELKKWQQVARRKVCGIVPIWAFVLAAVVFVLFGIILGATLAALKPKHGRRGPFGGKGDGQYESVIYTTLTTTFDAAPYSTAPTGLPDLPTGTFALPLSAPSAIQNSCLTKPEQSKAWSCSIPLSPLQIQVLGLPGASNPLASNEIILDYGNQSVENCYPYGTQPPVLDDPQLLSLVIDQQEPLKGPAWFFQTTYNKVVVVAEDLLSSPYANKRNLGSRDGDLHRHDDFQRKGYPSMDDFSRKGVAQEGDTPWFCYWNGTLLEAFLYVNLTSSEALHSASATTTSPQSETNSPSSSPSSDGKPTASSYSGPSWGDHEFLAAYPKVLKVQERRIPRGPQAIPPYCTMKLIAPDGSAQDFLNSTGQAITIYLNETEPETVLPITGRGFLYDSVEERVANLRQRQSSGSCGCVWLAT